MATVSVVHLVRVLSRINPKAFDAIFPHGPGPIGYVLSGSSAVGGALAASASELNPQPLPPIDALAVASAEVAQDIAATAVSAEASGTQGGPRNVARVIDDWCGTPWPRPWPFPWPLQRQNDPVPEPYDIGASRVVGALSLAFVASRLADGEARDALSKGAEQLMEAGLAEFGGA